MEKVLLEIKGTLCGLTVGQLNELCEELAISGAGKENVAGKTRTQIILHVTKCLEREELADLEDGGLSELLSIQDIITNIQMAKDLDQGECEVLNKTSEQDDLQKQLEALRMTLQEKEKTMQDLMKKNMNICISSSTPLNNMSTASPNSFLWRKDFKIAGQIGEPGQKDRLTFSSLARQIESGLSKGYPEPDVVDAVIRAITPGSQLRSYLEGKETLMLPALRRILRSHYQERGATELYKQLTSEVQNSKETPQSFLLRVMDLRQKILFASQEAESGLKYDPALVQSLFMHTVLTGLQNDNIRSDLQPYLLQINTPDELLMEKLNIASTNEKERQDKKKHAGPSRVTNVNAVQPNDISVETRAPTQQKVTVPPELLSEIKEMRSDMMLLKDLRAEVSQIRETVQRSVPAPPHYPPPNKEPETVSPYQVLSAPQPTLHMTDPNSMFPAHWQPSSLLQNYKPVPHHAQMRNTAQFQQRFAPQRYYSLPRPPPRCFACVQTGEQFCQHCFRCGSSEHFRAGCKAERVARPARNDPLN